MKNFFQNKLKTVALLFALLLVAGKANAQCLASFTFSTNGQTVTFTNTSTGTTVNTYYYWNFGDSQYGYNQNEVHTYQYGGTYVACLTIIDSLNNCYSSACDSFTIVGPQAPCNASFYSSNSGFYGVFYSNSTGVSNNTVYSWSFGDNTSGTGNSTTHLYTNGGWYNVCLFISDPSIQCADSFCQYEYIPGNNTTSCTASFTSSTSNNFGSFFSTSTGTTSNTVYNWNFGDGFYGSGQNTSHAYTFSGWYNVCLTITDFTTNCADSTCQYVYISGNNTSTCTANFTHTSSGSTTSFTDASTGTNVNTNYFWDFGDGTGNYSSLQNPSYTFQYSGTYTVCLFIWDSLNTCSSYYCDTVTVSGPNMPCNASFLAFPDTVNTHNTWVYNMATGTNPMQYTWSWGDNSPDDYTQYPSHTYPSSGIYVICLTIVDANLCTSTWCDSVNVQRMSAEWVAVPSTINVVNPAGINEVSVSHNISIYPNPANDIFYVNGRNLENMKFAIYDVLGNEVLNGSLNNNSVNVNELTPAVYIFKIADSKGNVFTKQFIKN